MLVVLQLAALAAWLIMAPAQAAEPSLRWSVAAGTTYVDYREYGVDDQRLNHESGLLPGVRVALAGEWARWFMRAQLAAFQNRITYQGQTQSGRPLQTHTNTRLQMATLQLGYWLTAARSWGVFAHVAGQQWNRQIQPTATVQGLSERYRWLEAGAGLQYRWQHPSRRAWWHGLRLAAFGIVDQHVRVRLSAVQGLHMRDVRLHAPATLGARLTYTATRNLGHGLQLQLSPQLAYWRFKRSATVRGTTEPRSQTWRVALLVGVRF